jgi:glycerol-3-phosphate acyltransferase PlsX
LKRVGLLGGGVIGGAWAARFVLNGVVVKSHGGTDALGFATAIDVALEIVRNDLVSKIKADVEIMTGLLKQPEAQAEPSL